MEEVVFKNVTIKKRDIENVLQVTVHAVMLGDNKTYCGIYVHNEMNRTLEPITCIECLEDICKERFEKGKDILNNKKMRR